MVHRELWLAWLLLGLVAIARCRKVPIKAPQPLAPRRALAGYEDGVCDEDRAAEDPDCDTSGSGGVPATACARTAGMAAADGFPGACMVDQGCMSIQLFQLDTDCGGAFASPPTCSQACYPVAASIGEACRWELLSWEQSFNARQAAWGGQQYWIWQPLFAACGLAGGSSGTPGGSGGTPGVVEPAPGGGGTNTGAAGNDTFCDKASQAAEQLGYTGACRNDSACQAANVTQMDVDCAGAFAATPTCSEACTASLAAISEGCRWELLLWQEAYNNESIALGGITVEIWNLLYTACNLTAAVGTNNTGGGSGSGGGSERITLNRLPDGGP